MKKKPSHLARLTEMVSTAVANMPPEQQRLTRAVTDSTVEIDPTLCRMNDLHRRVSTDGPDLEEFVESLKAVGQITPAKGWEIDNPDGEGKRYILVYGARRRAAAEKAGMNLRVELVPEPSRKDLIRMMYGENSNRKDYSALERGLEFKAYMEAGEASTLEELAIMLGEGRSTISRCLQIAGLPREVIDAYPAPSMLTHAVGSKLASTIERDPTARARVIQAALEWKQKGGTQDPSNTLLAALAGKAKAKPDQCVLRIRKGIYGRVTGLSNKEGPLNVQLRRGAPAEFRDDLISVIRKHFPGFEG